MALMRAACGEPKCAGIRSAPVSAPRPKAWAAAQGVGGRVGRPDDIGDIIAFLASDDARWINGQVLDATGGGLLGVGKMTA
ncbi:MAG: short-chain dehydrogenase [Mycobacterium sp.]|jgi:NAD(P)-dependent dehydrogenase (short-subunit alcohol dehydrogenase family)|nr:short-chain dehydrogenase [Mycobacterium sp.]